MDALFEVVCKSGEQTWVPYSSVKHLDALKAYFEAIGVKDVANLGQGPGVTPDDPEVFLGYLDTLPSQRRYMKEQEHKTYQVARCSLHPSSSLPAFYLFAISMAPLPLPLPAITNANLTHNKDGFIILLDAVSNDYHQLPVTSFCKFICYDSIIRKARNFSPIHLDHYAPLLPLVIIECPAKESGAEAWLQEALIKDATTCFIKGVKFHNKSRDQKEEKRKEALCIQKAREATKKNSHSQRDDHTGLSRKAWCTEPRKKIAEQEVFGEVGLAVEGNLGNLFDLDLALFPLFDQELELTLQDEQGELDAEGEEVEPENMDMQL
ncbi:hypothetical protein C8Q72DRAFT_889784 [Fomitopsis betulina]|nr:hypothetical protein C8Q72DRAFT_889784 [Fomitopsis betulina]